MKLLLILAALIGSAVCHLNLGYEYTYDYEGRMTMGLPQIRSRMVGTAIKAKVILQVIDEYVTMAKLTNVMVGEDIADTGCHGSTNMHINFKPISGNALLLQEPFEIHFRNQEANIMVVTKGEEEWITDIRKSIAYSLNLHTLNRMENPHDLTELYEMEQTFFGKCSVSYTLVPNARPFVINSRTFPQSNAENYTEVIRAIDFDDCRDVVTLSHASIGNLTHNGKGQFSSLQSRSSVGRYILDNFYGNTYDIKQVVVEGNLITSPFGVDTEKLVTFTNQTFYLTGKSSIGKRFVVPTPSRFVRTWNMEVASPYDAPSTPVPWINYFKTESQNMKYLPILAESVATGINLTQSHFEAFEHTVRTLITEAAQTLQALPEMPQKKNEEPNPWKFDVDTASNDLDTAVRIISALPISYLDKIFEEWYQTRHQSPVDMMKHVLFTDVMAASGGSSPVHILLEKIQQHKISKARTTTVFITLTNNIVSPTVLRDIMEYAMSLNLDQDPYLTSAVWINFASTLNRLCINPYMYKYSIPAPVFGNLGCNNQELLDIFLPFLKRQLDQTQETWKRVAIVQALGNLGTPETLYITKQVIDGEYDQTMRLRVMAMYSLIHDKQMKNSRHEIFRILMPYVSDPLTPVTLRQVAILVMNTWQPTKAYWARLAQISTDPQTPRDLSAFIYFVATSYAKANDPHLAQQAKMAQFVLASMRPYDASYLGAYENFWAAHLPRDHMDSEGNLQWLEQSCSLFPQEGFMFLYNYFGGIQTPLFEVMYTSSSVLRPMRNLFDRMTGEERQEMVRDRHTKRAQDALRAITEQLKPRSESNDDQEEELNMNIAFFKTMQFNLPINKQLIEKVMGAQGMRLLKELVEGRKFYFTKFVNPVQIETFLPSEIGLPIFTRVSTPTIFAADSNMTLWVNGKSNPTLKDLLSTPQTTLNVQANLKYITKTLSTVRALTPWNQQSITTGVDSLKNFNMPAHFNFTYSTVNHNVNNFTLAVEPIQMQQFPVVHMHNIPFVAIRNLMPGNVKEDNIKFDVIKTVEEKPLVEERFHLNQNYFGVNAYLEWTGDVPYPFTRGYIIEYLSNPQKFLKLLISPSAKLWATTIAVDFSKSQTKAFYPSIAFVKPVSSSRSSPFSPQEDRKIENEPLSEMYNIVPRILLNGTQSRFFEMIFSYKLQRNVNSLNEFKAGISVQRSALPGFDSKPAAYCFDVKSTTPYEPTWEQVLNDIHSKKMEMTTEGKITGGSRCEEVKIADFNGKVTVSEEMNRVIDSELQHMCSDIDEVDPLLELDTFAVYDKAFLDVNYNEQMPVVFKNYTYNLYDIVRGFAFPHSYFNYMNVHNQAGKVHVRGERKIFNHRWYVNTSMPTENAYFEKFWVPYAVEDLLPIGGLWRQHMSKQQQGKTSSYFVEKRPSGICSVTPEKGQLVTYDGTYIPFAPTPCNTVLFTDKQSPDSLIVKLRQSSQSSPAQVEVVSPRSGVTVEMQYGKVEVNSQEQRLSETPKEIRTQSGRKFAEVRKSGQFVELRIPGEATIRVSRSNQVLIEPSMRLRGQVSGLCGNFNGQPEDDLAAPSGKSVEQSQKGKLPVAWTLNEGERCDSQKLEEEKREVKQALQVDYQRTEMRSQRSGERKEQDEQCMAFVYPIKKVQSSEGTLLCITKEAVAMCLPRCQEKQQKNAEDEYTCFQESKAPKELKRQAARGYAKKPIRAYSNIQKALSTNQAIVCEA